MKAPLVIQLTPMLLTVEMELGEPPSEVQAAICFDDEGLEFLIQKLERLRGKKDHEHLMTPSWAGSELTEAKQGGPSFSLIHHLRLVKT